MEQAAKHLPAGREAAGDDPVHGRQARRQGRPRQRGPARPRPAVRVTHAVRVAAGRDGPRPEGARTAYGRARGASHHPGHAGVHQRSDIRLAEGRLRHASRGGRRGRAGTPGRDLHLHGRADAGPDPATDPGRGPGGRGHRARRPDPADLGGARHDPRPDHRLPGPLPERGRRLDRIDRGHLDRAQHDHRGPDQRAAHTNARSRRSVPRRRARGSRRASR